MDIQKCDKCYQSFNYPMIYDNIPNTIHLSGNSWVYMDGSKKYLKECCLETYLVGINNCLLNYDQQREICNHFKGSVFKILLIDNKTQHKVFELKENKYKSFKCARSNTKIMFDRCSIRYTESNESYGIYTNSEFKKHLKTLQEPSTSIDVDMINGYDLCSYIYLLQDRTAVAINASVFKVGKTTQPNFERFKNYPKGYKVILHLACSDCHSIEKNIIELFKQKYTPRLDYDTESFEGNCVSMKNDILNIITNSDNCI